MLQTMTRRYVRLALDAADGASLVIWALLLAEAACLYDPAAGGQITCPGLQLLLHSWLGRPAAGLPDALSQLRLVQLAHLTLLFACSIDGKVSPAASLSARS